MGCSNRNVPCNCPPGPPGPPGLPGSSGGSITITSPASTIAVGGSTAAPTLDINWGSSNVTEGIQDIIGGIIPAGIISYSDATNSFTVPAGALPGQMLVINPAGTGFIYVTPASNAGLITGTAVTALSADRVVKLVGNNVSYYEPGVDSPLSTLGVTANSAGLGGSIDVSVDGVISTTMTPNGPRWAGGSGVMLTNPPSSGTIHGIGRVNGPVFIVEISDAIL